MTKARKKWLPVPNLCGLKKIPLYFRTWPNLTLRTCAVPTKPSSFFLLVHLLKSLEYESRKLTGIRLYTFGVKTLLLDLAPYSPWLSKAGAGLFFKLLVLINKGYHAKAITVVARLVNLVVWVSKKSKIRRASCSVKVWSYCNRVRSAKPLLLRSIEPRKTLARERNSYAL